MDRFPRGSLSIESPPVRARHSHRRRRTEPKCAAKRPTGAHRPSGRPQPTPQRSGLYHRRDCAGRPPPPSSRPASTDAPAVLLRLRRPSPSSQPDYARYSVVGRFPSPLQEPDVRVSPHPAHASCKELFNSRLVGVARGLALCSVVSVV